MLSATVSIILTFCWVNSRIFTDHDRAASTLMERSFFTAIMSEPIAQPTFSPVPCGEDLAGLIYYIRPSSL